jgi:hypothetical protein
VQRLLLAGPRVCYPGQFEVGPKSKGTKYVGSLCRGARALFGRDGAEGQDEQVLINVCLSVIDPYPRLAPISLLLIPS